jgi:hypothetical protein
MLRETFNQFLRQGPNTEPVAEDQEEGLLDRDEDGVGHSIPRAKYTAKSRRRRVGRSARVPIVRLSSPPRRHLHQPECRRNGNQDDEDD